MSQQVFTRKVKKENLIRNYLLILNGLMRLTERELTLLEHGIKHMEPDGVLFGNNVILFTIRRDLNMSNYNFNNFVMRLKKKTVIRKDENNCWVLNPLMMFDSIRRPRSLSVVFKIEIEK